MIRSLIQIFLFDIFTRNSDIFVRARMSGNGWVNRTGLRESISIESRGDRANKQISIPARKRGRINKRRSLFLSVAALKVKLTLRRPINQLVAQGIMPCKYKIPVNENFRLLFYSNFFSSE